MISFAISQWERKYFTRRLKRLSGTSIRAYTPFLNLKEDILADQHYSILVALNDSVSSRAVMDFLVNLKLGPEGIQISLVHFFRKPSASEELMGKKFTDKQASRISTVLQEAKDKLVKQGFNPENIETDLVRKPYQTIADGIIDQVNQRNVNLVVIGRKRMSKAEEFVMGDISIKLIRALEGVAVLVVKSR